jgi:hypothetical protein
MRYVSMIAKDRTSIFVQMGRKYQAIAPSVWWMDYLLYPFFNKKKVDTQLIILLAPPRSGSTITYQLLCSAIENTHLTNISNTLYSTPLLASLISKVICSNRDSKFNSNHGFVPGLCGEAEGLAFWNYWSGLHLHERKSDLKCKKTELLKDKLNRISTISNANTFIAGYLGHIYGIDMYRKIFPRVLFIHLIRDPISNAASIHKIVPGMSQGYFSTRPARCEKKYSSQFDLIVDQLYNIHDMIISRASDDDMIHVRYEDICKNPREKLRQIILTANKMGYDLEPKTDSQLPQNLPFQLMGNDYEHFSTFTQRLKNINYEMLFENINIM